MNNAVIIQESWSTPTGAQFYEMMRLGFPRHSAYAKAHNFDFWPIFGDYHEAGKIHGAWDKVHLMLRAFEMGYQYVAWIDADAAIADMDCDLRDAVPEGALIGLCAHDPDKSEYLRACNIPKHLNVGVMYVKNSPLTIIFLRDWLSRYPGDARWAEQGTFNDMSKEEKYAGVVVQIDDTWNATVNVNMVERPCVLGWHGVQPPERRLAMMRESMKDDFIKFRA